MHTKKFAEVFVRARSRSARVASRARVPRRSTTLPSVSDGTRNFFTRDFHGVRESVCGCVEGHVREKRVTFLRFRDIS